MMPEQIQATAELSTVAICEAAFSCESMFEAGKRLGLADLPGLLASRQALQTAWRRGRLLRQLGELAASPICPAAIAERLGLDEEGFEHLLSKDPEARDVYQNGRHQFFIKGKLTIQEAAARGAPYAVRALERLLRAEADTAPANCSVDFTRLSPTEIEKATGIHRQQILRWCKGHGLPGNADGSWSLPILVAWLRKSPIGKTRGYRQKPGALQARIIKRIEGVLCDELGTSGEARCEESTSNRTR